MLGRLNRFIRSRESKKINQHGWVLAWISLKWCRRCDH